MHGTRVSLIVGVLSTLLGSVFGGLIGLVSAYYGDTYSDHGKLQALFEYASMLGELVELDAVSLPTYDWGSAAATWRNNSDRTSSN